LRAHDYILARQTSWAENRGISLMGSKGARGKRTYTPELNLNLFEPLLPEVKESFLKGDGNEILGSPNSPAKMQAVHSSSVLGVNVFHYWQSIGQISEIAAACGFCNPGNDVSEKIVFEDKYPIDPAFSFPPNIDVVFHNKPTSRYQRFAVECKFSEAYGSMKHGGMKSAYLKIESIWRGIPNLKSLAELISPDDNRFDFLHPAQLIKHILGLKQACGKNGFRLLYLWYDVPGREGAVHREEINTFSQIAKSDKIKFHALSYQELISRLNQRFRDDHNSYISYMTGRYL